MDPKPWSVADFERFRVHLTLFVRSEIIPLIDDAICRRILIDAPVKCGKKDIVEYIAVRDIIPNPKRVHAYVSAWHRTADEEQRVELKEHNLSVFSITSPANVDKFNKWLDVSLAEGKELVIHMDECDYGSGSKQTLSKIWSKIRMSRCITTILYSATPEEVLFSEEVGEITDEFVLLNREFREGERVTYTPPEGYCGAERFLREGLVHEAMPFFEKGERYSLSHQAKELIANMKLNMETHPMKNILILRLSGSFMGEKMIDQFLNHIDDFVELKDSLIIADKSDKKNIKNKRISLEKIQWSNEYHWRGLAPGVLFIYVIDQTCSRSTELKCHHRIYAMHDYRNSLQYNTVCQAELRVIHYEQNYDGFQSIQVYGSPRTFKFSARQITIEAFLNREIKKKKITSVEKYKILYTADDSLHPSSSEEGMDERDADHILRQHGCFAEISISPRIDGSVREVPVYKGEWVQMKPEEWDTKWPKYAMSHPEMSGRNNPFHRVANENREGDRWKGDHRGWRHLNFMDEQLYEIISGEHKRIDLGSTGGNRIKICYQNGEIGILAVYCIGKKQINTLHAVKSMFTGNTVSS